MESQAKTRVVFQAETQAKMFLLNWAPAAAATDYSEVMASILMEVLTLMSAGKFPPGVKKKEHVSCCYDKKK